MDLHFTNFFHHFSPYFLKFVPSQMVYINKGRRKYYLTKYLYFYREKTRYIKYIKNRVENSKIK